MNGDQSRDHEGAVPTGSERLLLRGRGREKASHIPQEKGDDVCGTKRVSGKKDAVPGF